MSAFECQVAALKASGFGVKFRTLRSRAVITCPNGFEFHAATVARTTVRLDHDALDEDFYEFLQQVQTANVPHVWNG